MKASSSKHSLWCSSEAFCLALTSHFTFNGLGDYTDDSHEVKGHPAGIKPSIAGRNSEDMKHEVVVSEEKLGAFLKKLTALREDKQRVTL